MLLVKLVGSRLVIVNFWGVKSCKWGSDLWRVSVPNPSGCSRVNSIYLLIVKKTFSCLEKRWNILVVTNLNGLNWPITDIHYQIGHFLITETRNKPTPELKSKGQEKDISSIYLPKESWCSNINIRQNKIYVKMIDMNKEG